MQCFFNVLLEQFYHYANAASEVDLNGLRAEFAEMIRTARRRTGLRLEAASTVTVTRLNLEGIPGIVRWFLANADAFKMVSFQPIARYFCIVSHHFMNATEIASPLRIERRSVCVFRVPVNGRLEPMCAVNAGGELRLWADFGVGFVFFGGLLGAACAGLIFARIRGLSFVRGADYFAVAIPIGHAIGRIGCFFTGCCSGRLPHPVQLYESFGLAIIALVCRFALSRVESGTAQQGTAFRCYLIKTD